jgi:sulfonate transport system permease protein
MSAATTQRALRAARREARRARSLDIFLAVATPVVLIVAWQLAASSGAINAKIFTPPLAILRTAHDLIAKGTLGADLGITAARLGAGYAIGAVLGTVVGLALAVVRPLRAALSPLFAALYAVPQIALLPLLLVIFGLGETPKIITVAAVTFFVVELNTLGAVRRIPPELIEAGTAYGARGWRRFRYILLPAAAPGIFTGLRVAVALALVVVTATEFVAANSGLGYLVWNSWELFEPADMYVGLITIALVGVVATGIVVAAERLVLPWTRRRAR